MLVVAAWVAKIHFAVLDDGVRPIRNVKGAVGAELHVNGAEGHVGCAQEVAQFARGESSALVLNSETHDAVSAEIASHGGALPIVGELGAAHDFQAAEFRVIARADTFEFLAQAGIGEKRGAGQAVIEALVARAIRQEGLAVRIEGVTPRIAEAVEENIEVERAGAQLPDAAAVKALDAVGGLDVAVNVNGLIKIQAA